MTGRRLLRWIAPVAAALAIGAVGVSPATAEPNPATDGMGAAPAGSNDWSCTPSPEHPRPVVLVHGTNMSMLDAWSTLSPQLADAGYCVFALDYGGMPELLPPFTMHWGIGDITESSRQLARFVDAVRAATGSDQVDIVGHSQGGVVARQYLKFDGGAGPAGTTVHTLVSLGAAHHGTTFGTLLDIARTVNENGLSGNLVVGSLWGPAGIEQLSGSQFLTDLNAGGEVLPGVRYVALATRDDTVITPPENSFLSGSAPDATVENVWIQDGCDTATVSHGDLTTNPRSIALTMNALATGTAAGPAPCE